MSPARDTPSPVQFQSPKRRVVQSPMVHRAKFQAPRSPPLTKTEPSPRSHRNRFNVRRRSSPKAERAATKIQTCWRRYHQRKKFLVQIKYQCKINKLAKKLANIEAEKQAELGEISKIVHEYKEQTKAKALKKKATRAEKSKQAEEIEQQVAEMKKDNAQIAAKNEMLKKNSRNLRINNLRLEKSAESSSEYYEQLKLHHDRCLEDNKKLTKVAENYKKKVDELSENLDTRTRFAIAEHRIRACYRKGIRDTVALGEETNDENLILSLYQIQESIDDKDKDWKEPEPLSPRSEAMRQKFKVARINLDSTSFLSCANRHVQTGVWSLTH